MWKSRLFGSILVCCAWGLTLATAAPPDGNNLVLPSPVQAGLARYGELHTFSATYTEYNGPPLALPRGKEQAAGQPKSPLPADVCHVVWQNGKLYARRSLGGGTGQGAASSRRSEFAFDGTILAGGAPDRFHEKGELIPPKLVRERADAMDPDAEYFGVEALHPLGIRLPTGAGEVVRRNPLTAQLLALLEKGGTLTSVGTADLDGRPVTKVAFVAANPIWASVQKTDLAEAERKIRRGALNEAQVQARIASLRRTKELTPRELEYVYYLDPSLGYAVARSQHRSKEGKLLVQTDCSQHCKLPGYEIWLPQKSITRAGASKPGISQDF
jgi:hypothetical protein